MSKPSPKAPAASVALYEALVATQPGVERKGAAGTLALRLSESDRAAFLVKYDARQPVQYGAKKAAAKKKSTRRA